jgi:hypothetical protein|tara:strand:+ start:814 stop:1200 length:387 start_codon:yes stop_codon:yes gene_type:complete
MGIFNLKKRRPLEESEDFDKDLHSIISFLANVGKDVKEVYELGMNVKKLRAKERSETDNKKQIKLLEDEIKAWDKFLERYVMLQRDTTITGARVKKISRMLKEEAKQMDVKPEIKDLVKKKDEWVFNW